MRILKTTYLNGILLLLAFVLIACVDVSSTDSVDEESKEAVENVETPELNEGEETVEIGYSGPLSGPAAQYGINVMNGLEMAANEINKNGFEVNGTTYKLEIVALDDKYLPNETGVNVKRMVSENDPVAVWIPHSGGVFATQEFNEQDDFIIMAYTSEPRQYEQGNQLMIGIPPQYKVWSEPFSQYVMDNFGGKMALLPTNSQYGKDWSESIVPVWEEMGGEIVYETEIDFAKETDYFTIMTNALNQKPDVLFVGGPSEPTALVIKQAKELGFEGGFMIMDQAKLEEMSGFLGSYDLLNGSIGSLPIENFDSDSSDAFVETYKNNYGEPYATSESALNYQSVYVLVEAMKAAGTVSDRKAIMEAVNTGIKNMPEDKLVLPLKEIDEVGSLQWEFDAGIVEDGEVEIYPVE
ncbi:ABC transporter substrate-binding protein [Oceanobacillus damuensis]|uniref:ABC transporter substrate-binding protein n=1 Tax=Oceanobacillus damuensis TaxID=937928 RepID=UPI00082AF191|nr:ABC transporter substrate-binding protein [Oceanobacillus damuensis]